MIKSHVIIITLICLLVAITVRVAHKPQDNTVSQTNMGRYVDYYIFDTPAEHVISKHK